MTYLDGIDVSQWQAATPPLVGQAFAFARATYGTGIDTRYAMHAANFRKAGIVTGAYAFGTVGDGAAQAAAFLKVAHDADLLALDLEQEPAKPPMTEAQARAFIAAMHGVGRQIGLYHSNSGFPFLGQDWDWIARWTNLPPVHRWTFWQYQGKPIDRDRYNGTLADLHQLAGIATGGGMPINTSGYNVSSSKVAIAKVKASALDAPGGKQVTTVTVGTALVAIGLDSGFIACLVPNATLWPDKIVRPTVLYLAAGDVTLQDAPAPVTTTGVKVDLSINGAPAFSETF